MPQSTFLSSGQPLFPHLSMRLQISGCLTVSSLEKEMANHSSIFAWKISQTEEPGGQQAMGSERVGHS